MSGLRTQDPGRGIQDPGRGAPRRAGFTLIEMMLVVALASILMSMLASSLIQARNHARKAKAEAELREMTAAFIQYYNTYGKWPADATAEESPVTEAMLQPLVDPAKNDFGIVFLNKTFTAVEVMKSKRLYENEVYYLDPWDRPYQMTFGIVDITEGKPSASIVHKASVWFPNQNRRW